MIITAVTLIIIGKSLIKKMGMLLQMNKNNILLLLNQSKCNFKSQKIW